MNNSVIIYFNMAFQQEYKLADYFSVIGLDEELKSID